MRYFKIALILFFLLLVLVFIFQNSAVLASAVELKYGFGEYVLQKSPPLYMVIFAALFLGAFLVAIFDLAIIFRSRSQSKKQLKEIKALENELSKFRNQPLSDTNVSLKDSPKDSPEVETEAGNQ